MVSAIVRKRRGATLPSQVLHDLNLEPGQMISFVDRSSDEVVLIPMKGGNAPE
jgi:bifunctional DNA-binding transcriptional regulator/antitoxin component of YhaV-PrlF toxin-antitoxin module